MGQKKCRIFPKTFSLKYVKLISFISVTLQVPTWYSKTAKILLLKTLSLVLLLFITVLRQTAGYNFTKAPLAMFYSNNNYNNNNNKSKQETKTKKSQNSLRNKLN